MEQEQAEKEVESRMRLFEKLVNIPLFRLEQTVRVDSLEKELKSFLERYHFAFPDVRKIAKEMDFKTFCSVNSIILDIKKRLIDHKEWSSEIIILIFQVKLNLMVNFIPFEKKGYETMNKQGLEQAIYYEEFFQYKFQE